MDGIERCLHTLRDSAFSWCIDDAHYRRVTRSDLKSRKVPVSQAEIHQLDLVDYYSRSRRARCAGQAGRPKCWCASQWYRGAVVLPERAPESASPLDRGGDAAVSVGPNRGPRSCRRTPASLAWMANSRLSRAAPASSACRRPRSSDELASISTPSPASIGRRCGKVRGLARAVLESWTCRLAQDLGIAGMHPVRPYRATWGLMRCVERPRPRARGGTRGWVDRQWLRKIVRASS